MVDFGYHIQGNTGSPSCRDCIYTLPSFASHLRAAVFTSISSPIQLRVLLHLCRWVSGFPKNLTDVDNYLSCPLCMHLWNTARDRQWFSFQIPTLHVGCLWYMPFLQGWTWSSQRNIYSLSLVFKCIILKICSIPHTHLDNQNAWWEGQHFSNIWIINSMLLHFKIWKSFRESMYRGLFLCVQGKLIWAQSKMFWSIKSKIIHPL